MRSTAIFAVFALAATSVSGCGGGSDELMCQPMCPTGTTCTVNGCEADSPIDLAMPPPPQGDMAGTCNPMCADSTPYCNPNHLCVACLMDSHCPMGQICKAIGASSVCAPGCSEDARCGGGSKKCCGGACLDTATDPNNCGACGMACGAVNSNAKCVGGACMPGQCLPGFGDCNQNGADGCETRLRVDLNNCTACGKTCKFANALAGCSDGCYLSSCNFGFDDCNGDEKDGCETTVVADKNNCGACGMKCPVPAHTTVDCVNATCQLTRCDLGYSDCNKDPKDGCEVATGTDAKNCGMCGSQCPQGLVCVNGGCTCQQCNFANANSQCINNVCVLNQCLPGFANCDNNPANGCEVNLNSDANNCASCGIVCPQGQVCFNAKCQVGCAPTGQRAAFNTISKTTTGCYHGPTLCSKDNYDFSDNGASNFQAYGESVTCSAQAPICVANVGITTYTGGNPVCQGIWNVFCDGVMVGSINTINLKCGNSAMASPCKVNFQARPCTAIQLVAAQDMDGDQTCCGGNAPDSMLSSVSVW